VREREGRGRERERISRKSDLFRSISIIFMELLNKKAYEKCRWIIKYTKFIL